MNVPFLDLRAQYQSIKDEIDDAVNRVIASCAFAGGPFVEEFEQEFAKFCGCNHAIGVGSGTEALWLSLVALGIGRGDEVITVPNTFIATAEAISLCGATPVFVDVDESTYNMDPALLEKAVTQKTKAIIPVHLYGQMADMKPIVAVAEKFGLVVIEDACQAHGAEYYGHKAGTIGVTGCFSFYPGKNLGAYGDAGAVVTNQADLAQTMRYLRDHGQMAKYRHTVIGWNARMDGIQGAVLTVKLKHLAAWNASRRQHAARYTHQLAALERLTLPAEAPWARHVYHIYPIRVENRDGVLAQLEKTGVHCGIHYPVPIHLQPAYWMLNLSRGTFPRAESYAETELSLPMYPELSDDQIAYVADALRRCL
jgi:dTDP-4-amino-4,6-dideoxygalactose transaminase